jgi:hypothetical protein
MSGITTAPNIAKITRNWRAAREPCSPLHALQRGDLQSWGRADTLRGRFAEAC